MSEPVFTHPNPADMPDVILTETGRVCAGQILTSDNVDYVLGVLGITARYDLMRHMTCLVHPDFTTRPKDQLRLRQLVYDCLQRCRIARVNGVEDALHALAMDDTFHPMADWIPDKWDGVDRFEALVASVPTDSVMWRTYLRKWMIQVCEAVHGSSRDEPRSLPNVLVFVGDQGIGKGRWLRSLAPATYVMADAELHLSSSQGKDHQVQALRYPIVELGEIDSTFRKADVSALKAFLSRQTDEIREPYARAATKHLRCTVFFGTVNDVEFLNDGTGTRRYWPVDITGPINWDHGIDLQQLWAQATSWWEKGEEWFLDGAQDKQRVAASDAFTMTSPVADMLAAHMHEHKEKWGEYVIANKTEILRLCGVAHPNMAQVADASRWLTANLGKHRKLKGKQRCWAVPAGERITLVSALLRITDTEAKTYVKWKT